MLEICIQTSYDQNVQLILKSYLPVVYGTPLSNQLECVVDCLDRRLLQTRQLLNQVAGLKLPLLMYYRHHDKLCNRYVISMS